MKEYKIGRYAEADIVLVANYCSRDHAKLTLTDSGELLLQDYSANGTVVKGKKVHQQTVALHYGDEVLLAGVEKLDWSKIERPSPKESPISPPVAKTTEPFARKYVGKMLLIVLVVGLGGVVIQKMANVAKPQETPMNPSEIYTRYQNAVALVQVKYFIHIHTKANDLYFGLDQHDSVSLEKSKSDLKPFTSEGTAFYIDSNGTLITNRHVVEPWKEDKALQNYFNNKIKPSIKQVMINKGWGNDEPTYQGELEAVNIYPNRRLFTTDNGIECKIKKVAQTDEIDLASIQISSHRLPSSATVISAENIEGNEEKIKVNTAAYVIGFPLGDALAVNEANTINCSSTQGSFTQAPSASYIQYSAATASGGSGSPVFDQYGRLVAITYLGFTKGQSFNRGILAKYIGQTR